jgi:SAM domain (Sterile alpha motif)
MQQIPEWLEKLGMSEYAQRFAENRIDLSVLPDLTDQDLEKLGVVLGDRRKMLRAIANLDNAQPAVASAPAASVQPIAVTTAVPTGERRHVTVMFCDLVDSTGIASQLDAEVAGLGWRLSRCGHGGSDRDGRQGRQEAWRRADGAVWLPIGARE